MRHNALRRLAEILRWDGAARGFWLEGASARPLRSMQAWPGRGTQKVWKGKQGDERLRNDSCNGVSRKYWAFGVGITLRPRKVGQIRL